jgi:hypothetical protein
VFLKQEEKCSAFSIFRRTPFMSKVLFSVLVTLLGAISFTLTIGAQNLRPEAAIVGQSEAAKWREDLRYMAEEMPKWHKNLFHTMSPEQFAGAVRNLHERIPQLARHEIIVEMAKIVALVGEPGSDARPENQFPGIARQALPFQGRIVYSRGQGRKRSFDRRPHN